MSTEKFITTVPIDTCRTLIRDVRGDWHLHDQRRPARLGDPVLSKTDQEMINAALRAGIAYQRAQ